MNILLLSSSFPARKAPLLGIFVKDLAQLLGQYGHHVHLVTPASTPDDDEFRLNERVLVHYFKYPGYQNRSVDSGKGISFFSTSMFLLKMFLTAYPIITRCHISIIHCYWLIPSGFVGVLLKHIFGIPVVVTTPGSDINIWSYKTIPGLFIRYTLKHITYLLALGEGLKNRAVELGIPPQNVLVTLGNGGINPRQFSVHPVQRQERIGLNIPDGAFVAMFAGRFDYPKRVDLIIPLVQHCRQLWLILIGDGQNRPQYEQLAETYHVADRVLFTGVIPHAELASYYSLADVMLYPSEHEGLPSAIREALCMGIPVIASHVGGIPDIVKHEVNGYLVENSVDAFLAALQRYMQSPRLQRRMRENSLVFAQQNLVYTAIMPQILEVYRSIMP